MGLVAHLLFEGGEALPQRVQLRAELLDLCGLLLKTEVELFVARLQTGGALVEGLDAREADAREVLHADGLVARAEPEGAVEVFGHRAEVARAAALGDVVPGRDRDFAKPREHVLAVHVEEVLLRGAARSAVEDARAGGQVAARRAAEVRAEAEAARRASRELVVRRVAERVGRSLRRAVRPDERALEAVVRGELAHGRRVILVGRHVVADGDGREAADVEGLGVALAVDVGAARAGVVAERDAVGVAHAVARAGREPGRALHLVAAAEDDGRGALGGVRVAEGEGVEAARGRVAAARPREESDVGVVPLVVGVAGAEGALVGVPRGAVALTLHRRRADAEVAG